MIDDEVTGVKLNWGPEKKPSKFELILPKNSPILISDYHSIWGASGGMNKFYWIFNSYYIFCSMCIYLINHCS